MSDEKKPTYQDLEKIEKHPGFYLNPLSKKITYRKSHGGKRIKIPTGKTKISEAKKFVEDELEKLRSGTSLRTAKRKRLGIINPLLSDIYAEMVEVKAVGKAKSTVVNYWQAWKIDLEPFWGEKNALEVTYDNVNAWKAWYIARSPSKLSEKAQDHLKMLFRFMVKKRYLFELPDLSELETMEETIKGNAQWKKVGRVYTEDEQLRLMESWKSFLNTRIAGTTERHKVVVANRVRCAIYLGIRRGIRIDEVCQILKEKIDFKLRVLEVWSTKNLAWRDIPIDDELEEILTAQLEANAHFVSPYLFPMPSDPARPLSDQTLRDYWNEARSFAGIVPKRKRDARFHDLRKTFATLTAIWGWPPKTACEILDMSLTVYEKTYANNVGLAAKAALFARIAPIVPPEKGGDHG